MAKRPTLQLMVDGRIPVEINPVAQVKLVELLGVGGFGWAWKAHDTATDKPYVLKIIGNIKPGSVLAERVRLEAEVAVPSEYIVPVIGLRQWDPSTYFILFEYYPSRSLDKVLAAGPLSPEQRQKILHRLLIGVSDAHRHNIIHRDLKPANILVDDSDMVKIIDFGISKFKDKNITVSGDLMGTPAYMPIELFIHGSRVADARTDIYALGHIFYELAMGHHFWAHQGWKGLEDFINYLKQDPPPQVCIDLADFNCDFCDRAAAVIQRMVMLSPGERYASVQQVLNDLGYEHVTSAPSPDDLPLRSPMLIIESGSNRGARLVLGLNDSEQREVGRADLAGNDHSISRRHLEFSRKEHQYFVRDVGSKNGTLVRGLLLDPAGPPVEIQHGDRIKVGDIFLRFVFLKPE